MAMTQQPRELILPVFTQWERVGSLTSILADLTQGIFYDPALLVDQMFRDDRWRATWNLRLQAVLGLPSHFEPANKSKKAQKIADHAAEAWPRMLSDDELCELILWGLFLGAGVARQKTVDGAGLGVIDDDGNERDPEGGSKSWLPTAQTWHAGGLRFDLVTDRYMMRTYDAGEVPIERGDPNWILFTPWGHKYGRLRGFVLSIAMLFLDRSWTFRDRARHGEVSGQAIRQGITPLDADQREKDGMRRALSAVGTESVIITPQNENGAGYGVKLVEAGAQSHQTFSTHLDHVDRAMAILLLGQSASTMGQAGLGAQEKAGDQVMQYILRFDARCIASIAAQVLGPWTQMNYGSADLAPRRVIEVDPPEDGNQRASELNTTGDAVDKLEKHGADVRKMLEELGVPMLSEEDAQAKAKEAQERAKDEAAKGLGKEPA